MTKKVDDIYDPDGLYSAWPTYVVAALAVISVGGIISAIWWLW